MDRKNIVNKFKSLSDDEKRLFCIFMLDDIIISARGTYTVGAITVEDPIRLRMFNEFKHQIMNHIKTMIWISMKMEVASIYPEDAFLETVFKYFESLQLNYNKFDEYFKLIDLLQNPNNKED